MELLAEYFAELERRVLAEMEDEGVDVLSLAALATLVTALTSMLESALTPAVQEAYQRGILEFLALYSDLEESDVPDSDVQATVERRVAVAARGIDETTLRDLGRILQAQDAVEGGEADTTREEILLLFLFYRGDRSTLIAEFERQSAREAAKLFTAEIREKITGREMRKRSVNVGDGSVCPICLGNTAAGAIPLKKAFPSGHDNPGYHPRCRCWLAFESIT